MNFNSWTSLWDRLRHRLKTETHLQDRMPKDRATYYEESARFRHNALLKANRNTLDFEDEHGRLGLCLAESMWYITGRPYYKLYPGIVECLLKLDLKKVPSSILTHISARMTIEKTIEFRFAKGHEINQQVDGSCETTPEAVKDESPDTMLVHAFLVYAVENKIAVFAQESSLSDPGGRYQRFTTFRLECDEGKTVYEAMQYSSIAVPTELTKILVGVLLLAQADDELIQAELLSKDSHKTPTPRLIQKAINRGKFGWTVGASLERVPHYRRPHFAIRWTGTGRTVPRLRPIKGSIVHREKASSIPTGYQDVRSQDT